MPSTGVYDFAIGPDGRIWMATDGGGIATFDGESFKLHNESNGFPGRIVKGLHTDSLGSVWAVTQDHGLYRYNGKWMSVINDFPEIRAIVSGRNNQLFFGTAGGVAQFQDSTLIFPEWNNNLLHRDVRDLCFIRDTLWVGTDLGLLRVVDGVIRFFGEKDGLPSEKIVSLAAGSNGKIWVGTAQGLAHIKSNLIVPFLGNEDLPVKRIRTICESVDGTIWLGTYSGVVRLRPENEFLPEHISVSNGLADNRIRKVFQEPSGSIWFATYIGGVSQLTNTSFEHFTPDPAQKFAFSAISESPGNKCLAGVFENGLVEIAENGIRWIDRRGYSVRSISASHNGVQWFVHNEGLSYVQDDKVFSVALPDSLPDAFLYHCAVVGDSLLISCQNRILVRSANPQKKEDFRSLASFESLEIILDFELSKDKAIWAITDNQVGLWRNNWDEAKFLVIDNEELAGSQFTDIELDSFEHVWIGSLNRGVFRLSDGRVSRLHEGNGLKTNRVHQLLFDHLENLWVGGLHGMAQIILTAGNELIESINHFTYTDGLRSMHTNPRAAFCDSHNQLWFGTVDGVTNYNAMRKVVVPAPPTTHIHHVDLLFDPATDWSQYATDLDPVSGLPRDLKLPHHKNHLTFHFHGISLANPSSVVYQYKLDGVEEWSPITANRQVTYPNIPPGEYTFMVISRGDSGIWNQEPATFKFTIQQPFYLTFWFIGGCVLLLILGIWLVVRLREQRYRREKEYLEREVAARTVDLKIEKEKTDELLLNILPAKTAIELKEKGSADARLHRNVSVLFTDFEGFTNLAEKMSTTELVATVDECFKAFDSIVERYGAEKIKTIGDAYMCATGLPEPDPEHALNAVRVAVDMQRFMEQFNAERRKTGKPEWPLRVGIHSGPVVSGIVGRKKFVYDIWGDTVNLASRVESAGEAGKINVSSDTKKLIEDVFDVEYRGKIAVKNKGEVEMYFVK